MLSLNELNAYLDKLKGWDMDLNVLTKTYTFDNPEKIVEFLKKLIELSTELNHHPEIIINNLTVKVNLISREENAVTKKDFDLAEAIDKMTSLDNS